MKIGVALVVLLSLVIGISHGAAPIIKSVPDEGYDVIHLDWPSFVHEFRFNDAANTFYVYGGGVFREIEHGENIFQTKDANLSTIEHYFIDSRLFSSGNNGNDLYVVGINPSPANAIPTSVGFVYPVSVYGPNGIESHFNQVGYTFYGLTVDHRSFADVRVYLAGWYLADVTKSIEFVVVRLHLKLDANPPSWTWNQNLDKLVLYSDNYHTYHSTFKPRLFVDTSNHDVFVVDPATETIYKIISPEDTTTPISSGGTVPLASPTRRFSTLSGANWHYYSDMLYIGFAGSGEYNGTLLEVDLKNMKTTGRQHEFDFMYSNPRAIAGNGTDIWIAFEGGPAVVRFNTAVWKVTGFAHLPTYLHQVFTAWDTGYDHIYFASYEQHSKVYRIAKTNFCANDCPFNGFCKDRTCACIDGYELSQGRCDIKHATNTVHDRWEDKAAETALGILFAFAFVAAVIGWAMFYRARKATYTRVL